MSRRAFTLIELLVVIAIIAILAAILFPVFAQAKLQAKKAVAISNQKQIGLGILMYGNDADDMYPREDGCTLNDAMNPAFNNQPAGTDPTPFCNGTGSGGKGQYAFRDNHYSWQKWIQPYVKNTSLFLDPVQTADSFAYNTYGEVEGGYMLNIAITGALNTWGYSQPYTNSAAIRTSWLGGSATSVPAVAETMIVMEGPFDAVIPSMNVYTGPNATAYPFAVQEHWYGYFYNTTPAGSGPCSSNGTPDTFTAPYAGSVPVSYCDGHTKALPFGQILAKTPTAAQYGLSSPECVGYSGPNDNVYANIHIGAAPVWTQSWPFWGLQ